MKRILFLCLALISASAGIAQDYPSLLYRVTSPDSQEASFLFGTMHVSDSSITSMTDNLLKYIDSTVVFCNEIDMTDMQLDESIMSSMVFSSLEERDSIFSANDLKVITEFVDSKLPGMGAMMLNLKPFWIMASIVEIDLRISAGEVLDVQLQMAAESMTKLIRPLETMESQMQAINDVSLVEQREMLMEYIADYENQKKMSEDMVDAYIARDLKSTLRDL